MPVRALVAAGALFDLDENNVRVALTRLLAVGLVERDERGRYRAGERAGAVGRRIARWRRIEEGLRPWDGGWVAVLGAKGPTAGRALHFLGFRALAPGVHVRPDNLVGGVAGVREQLRALGLPADAIVTGLHELDEATAARARGLWDVRGLRASYRKARTALARSQRRLPRLGSEAAMVESFLLGGGVIRELVLDPLLPEPLLPAAERTAVVAAMRAYDRLGRTCWAAFMRGFDVLPEPHAPMHVRIADEAAVA